MVKLRYMGLLAIAVSVIVALSVTLPSANALIQRDNFYDNHTTFRYLGGQKICGDHLCKSGEYDKMLKTMYEAQRAATLCREALKEGKRC